MRITIFFMAVAANTFFISGCNKNEQTSEIPEKGNQQVPEQKNIMRMDKASTPDPSKYKGKF